MARSTSGYQPLSQAEEHVSDGEAAEDDVPFPQPPTRGIRRANRPVSIDLHKLDTAFKRFVFILPGHIIRFNWKLQMDRIYCSEDEA